MRLSELSERSGIPIATIKYYLREGLLPPGERVSATQARYSEEHLRRLGLARALIQVGRVPVATARAVLGAVDDSSLDLNQQLGAAVGSLPPVVQAEGAEPVAEPIRRRTEELLAALGWDPPREDPSYTSLQSAVAALEGLGYPCEVEQLLPYGRLAGELAASDLDLMADFEGPTTQLEAAVALTVLYEPVLLSLRRLAHTQEAVRRYSSEAGAT